MTIPGRATQTIEEIEYVESCHEIVYHLIGTKTRKRKQQGE